MGSIAALTAHALHIIKEEQSREIPSEPHCPQLARKTLPQLGSPTVKVEELNAKGNDNMASLKAAAKAERRRREADGIGDRVQNRQPIQPPTFDDDIVGKHLEVRYKVDVIDEESGKPTGEVLFVWWSCEVMRVSDGKVQKIGAHGKQIKGKHPAGHVLLRWERNAKLGEEEETESWMAWASCPLSGTQTKFMRGDAIRIMACGRTMVGPDPAGEGPHE